MADHHTLRPPRRARGVDDIGQVVRPHHHRRRIVATRLIPIHHQHRPAPRHHRSSRRGRDHRSHPAVGQQLPQPNRGLSKIKRNIGAARLQHPHHPHHHLRPPPQQHPHPPFRAHPQPHQPMRHRVRPALQLPKTEPTLTIDHSNRPRLHNSPRRQHLMHTTLKPDKTARVVPPHHHLMPLPSPQQLKILHRPPRMTHRISHHRSKLSPQPLHRRTSKTSPVITQLHTHPTRPRHHRQPQRKTLRHRPQPQRQHLQTTPLPPPQPLLKRKPHRPLIHIPTHEVLLPSQRLLQGLVDLVEHGGDRTVRADVALQKRPPLAQADRRLHLLVDPAVALNSQEEPALTGHPHQEHLPAGEE